MNQVIEVTTTCSCQESARKLADLLVEARLAACVQISGAIESVYRWEGQVQRATEWHCTIKISAARENTIARVHSIASRLRCASALGDAGGSQ